MNLFEENARQKRQEFLKYHRQNCFIEEKDKFNVEQVKFTDEKRPDTP